MVDAPVATAQTRSAARSALPAANPAFRVEIRAGGSAALAIYRRLCEDGIFAPAQSAAWIETWIEKTHPDSVLAFAYEDDRPVFALALEVIRRGPFRIAHLFSATHANGNFPPSSRMWLSAGSHLVIADLKNAIAADRPDIDVVALERLAPRQDGFDNPLLAFPSYASPNPSLAVDLTGGFDALLARSSGKRKRKKHRSQTRKFDAAGGFRRIEAGTPDEVDRLLDAFFAMKATRFRKAGIANVFGDGDVQAFFRELFTDALSRTPKPFTLHALEVGGKLRAVTGSSRAGDRTVCEFGAIVEDELAPASPGDFLFFDNIKEACDQGLLIYDFSVGDELYKRLWCDVETRHCDVVIALSIKGRVLAASLRAMARLKASIKGNRRLWSMIKTLRGRGGKQSPRAATDD